jgi:hypothetical protein
MCWVIGHYSLSLLKTEDDRCRGLVLRVSWVTGYNPKNLKSTLFPLVASDWGITHLVPGMVPPLLAEGRDDQTKKN